jgi:predicted nuclease of predicted toxin-antitoxin system
MKLLFDQNLSFKLCGQLADLFANSGHVRLLELAEADDRALWQYAGANGYVLVSLDADFAELAALRGPPPKVIWLRCGNQPTTNVARLLREHGETIARFERDDAACLEIY